MPVVAGGMLEDSTMIIVNYELSIVNSVEAVSLEEENYSISIHLLLIVLLFSHNQLTFR